MNESDAGAAWLRFMQWGVTVAFALATLIGVEFVHAQETSSDRQGTGILPEWSISGSNTLRLEHYEVGGDESSSSFPFEGPQPYDELFLNFGNRISSYERWSGNFAAVASDSRYRSTDNGLTVERLNLTREKGDTTVPYRVEAGDYFGYFSFRTLQRSLKGAQLDVQPTGGFAGERHSILALSGFVNDPTVFSQVGRNDWRAADFVVESMC